MNYDSTPHDSTTHDPAPVDAVVLEPARSEPATGSAAETVVLDPAPVRASRGSGARGNGNPADPSAAQLGESRAQKWHQDGSALLSIEALRDWVNRTGLVLYAPRAAQMSAPAPTLVEATLGQTNATPTAADGEAAKSLLTRLIAEGSAVPLNLMGAPGGLGTDVPDYVASPAVFSYIFTLRGNKAWKQAPETQGAVKVSPLALATYEMLAAKVTLSSYDLATQLGKEVTEAAVLRALTELWGQLRVIPVPQADGSATLWELTTARFTKQIKSGANAGQPSALSALISLYLAQAVLATEDEIETFLSPLAPRSRVRGILRDLTQARQLETLVIAGKTLLHVSGDLPAFAAEAVSETAETAPAEGEETGSRIAKFTPKPGGKLGTGMRAKPFSKPGSGAARGARPAYGKPVFGGQSGSARPGGDRERRPFGRTERGTGAGKPGFDKPWNEDRKRSFTASGDGGADTSSAGPRGGFSRDREGGGDSRPPRRDYAPRTPREGEAPRRTFSKPGTFGRKREGFGGADVAGARPPRRDFGGATSDRPRSEGRPERSGAGAGRSGGFSGAARRGVGTDSGYGAKNRQGAGGFTPRPSGQGAGSGGEGAPPKKVYRKFDAPRTKRPFDADRPQRRADAPRTGESSGGNDARPSYPKRPGGFTARPSPAGRAGFAARPEGGDRADGPKRSGGFGARPGGASERSGSFGPRKPGGFSARAGGAGARAGGSGPRAGKDGPRSEGDSGRRSAGGFAAKGGPFAKFADGKKPFRKPGKPASGKPAGRSSEGGFKPVRRKRPEGNAS